MVIRLQRWALLTAILLLGACVSTDNAEPPAPLGAFTPSVQVIELWSVPISSQVNFKSYLFSPHVTDDAVIVTDHRGNLTAFDRKNGSTRWRRSYDEEISMGVAGDAQNLFLGTAEGELMALDANDGAIKRHQPVPTSTCSHVGALRPLVLIRIVHHHSAPASARAQATCYVPACGGV